ARLAAWRAKHDDDADAWLWHETLRPFADAADEDFRALVLGKKSAFLRAAALEALAARSQRVSGGLDAAALGLEVLRALPRKEVERAVLIESVASLVLAHRRQVRDDDWKPVARLLIENLDDPATSHRSKVAIARRLARTFDSPDLGLEARWWLSELDRQPRTATRQGATVTVPFVSVRTTGYRFAYVIDASDSMLRRVTDRERRELGPTTGAKPKKEEKEAGEVPDADDIDWGRVITRFDAAREF